MKIFATSDTHFGHKKMIRYGRPENFEDRIFEHLWKKEGDILIHCGDFCIGQDAKWHEKFMMEAKGFKRKILVRGNHDNKSDSWYYDHGWDFVCFTFAIKYQGNLIFFSHKPQHQHLLRGSQYNFHGHLHGKIEDSHRSEDLPITYDRSFHIDLSPESWDYNIHSLEHIIHENRSRFRTEREVSYPF